MLVKAECRSTSSAIELCIMFNTSSIKSLRLGKAVLFSYGKISRDKAISLFTESGAHLIEVTKFDKYKFTKDA